MTREEAIKVLNMVESYGLADLAKRMAIKALEHPEQNVIAVVPCGDVISRQAVLDAMSDTWKHICSVARRRKPTKGEEAVYSDMVGTVKSMPSVTPKPKTGRWIYDRRRDWDGECAYECSECGMGSDDDHDYCPNCGAKMESEEQA